MPASYQSQILDHLGLVDRRKERSTAELTRWLAGNSCIGRSLNKAKEP